MTEEAQEALSRLNTRIGSLDPEIESMSGGQRQCISISRPVHIDARFLIMDEPTAALGMEESQKVIELIAELKQQGIGTLRISHDIHDVQAFPDRITILKDGPNVITAPTKNFT